MMGIVHTEVYSVCGIDLFTVDGTFCQAALDGKIQIKEQLPKYLGGAIQLGVYCTA